jgi:hypothetical protein
MKIKVVFSNVFGIPLLLNLGSFSSIPLDKHGDALL